MSILSCGFQKFKTDRDGSIAVLFSIAILPALFAVGSAIDYSRAASARAKLQQATDGAVLAAAISAPTMTDQKVHETTLSYLKGIVNDNNIGVRIDVLAISEGRTEVTLQTSASFKPMILNEQSVLPLAIMAKAKAVMSNKSYEIALVFDTSGSMANSAGGVSKMQSARAAAKKLVDTMYASPEAAKRTKMSLIPFAASVNAGAGYAGADWTDRLGVSSIHWQNLNRDGSSWLPNSRFDVFTELGVNFGGCFESRPDNWGVTDAAPTVGSPDSLFVPQFAPDEPGTKGQGTYWLNTGGTSKQGNSDTKYSYANSYLDDVGGACTTTPASTDAQARQSRICKYKINKDQSKLTLSSDRGPNHRCDTKPIVRLTDSSTTLKSAIDALDADGKNTNAFEGTMWGWRALSPNVPFADGKDYADAKTTKIMILLTDGENAWNSQSNHNMSLYMPFGFYKDERLATGVKNSDSARDALDAKTKKACENAKAAGVKIYTVGFSTPNDSIDAKGLSLLKNCASAESMAYVAQNSSSLQTAFEEIARNIGTLRIAK
jgi:Flp pilus assembly protein TadG